MPELCLSIRVPGRPVVLTAPASIAEPWKWAVARTVQENWTGGYIEEPCGLILTFHLDEAGMRLTALHNLLKATIDGLSHVLFKPGSYGHAGPWNRQDWWITHLTAEKLVAKGDPSVDIRVTDPMFAQYARIDKPAVEATIPGTAPLFAANPAKEKIWRQQLVNAVKTTSGAPNGDVALDFQFTIDPLKMKMADLDNFIVPATTAAAIALFGTPYASYRITTLAGVKQCGNDNGLIGTTMRAWSESTFDPAERFMWQDGDFTVTYPDQTVVSDVSTNEVRTEMVKAFIDDDAGFIQWRDTHPNAFIVNAARTPKTSYLVLHRTSCRHMNKLPPGYEHWTKEYIKICSDRIEDLADWARDNVDSHAVLRPCKHCHPMQE